MHNQGFASAVLDGVLALGTSVPSVAHLTVSFYLCSSEKNAPGQSRNIEGPSVSAQKALQGSKPETRELLGGTTENSVSRRGVSIDLLTTQINYFLPIWPP